MTNTEYLEQLSVLEDKIESQKLYIEELKSALSGLDAIRYDKDRVQSSPDDNAMLDQLIKIEDEESKLKKMIHDLAYKKIVCINMIHSIKNINYQKLLYSFYIEKESLNEASIKMGYSYTYVKKLHRRALHELDTICHPMMLV